ncbi:AAA family ATPase [Candidatus Kuenenbacteria bacterium]|nr:AAA family ATPase [Candidatus Kuenenbacteria bacterium]
MPTYNWPIIGHKKIASYLQSVIQKNTIGHAYLFYGAPGLGKNLMADLFVKSILCRSDQSRPCGSCSSCRELGHSIHPDVVYLEKPEDKKNISVEEVREARSKMQNFSLLHSYKVMIIRDADALSIGAINALLKILEEPVGKTIFIFIAEDIKFLPRTILSRLQVIKFLPVSHKEVEDHLVSVGYERHESYDLAHLSLGFPGRILPFVGHPKNFHEYQEKLSDILKKMSGSINERFSLVEELAGQNNSEATKDKVREFLQILASLVRDVLLLRSGEHHLVAHHFLERDFGPLVSRYSSAKLTQILSDIKKTSRLLGQNINLRLALENLILEF